jgi:3-dehydroquinate synthase
MAARRCGRGRGVTPAPLRLAVELGARSYPILIGSGLLADGALWRSDAVRGRHILIVSNDVVAALYLPRVLATLGRDAAAVIATLVLPDGEAFKTLDSAARVFAALADLKASRDATVVALGGGVIGDLAGFAAACWMRGIAFVQLPTTLLAMVDSSVGGKTAVDLAQGKNLVGAFHQPGAVIIDTDTLATLPARELRAGLAEVVKYGALGDAAFFAWLEAHVDALLARDPAALAQAIAACCRHKAAIVARDETEQGERALLNFGHSFAHALETASGYGALLHGEAVAIGMLLAARLSTLLGRAPAADAERLQRLLERCGLPTAMADGVDPQRLLDLMRLDKKNISGRLRLILWRGIGEAEIAADVDEGAVRAVLERGARLQA